MTENSKDKPNIEPGSRVQDQKLTTQGTQDEIKQCKNTTQRMLDTTMHTHTHN